MGRPLCSANSSSRDIAVIFEPLSLQGAFLLRPEPIQDERGHFARIFCFEEFARHGLQHDFPQHSISHNIRRGTLRGLHHLLGDRAETKLVRCVRGSVFDVIVDIRPASATRGLWLGLELSAENGHALYIPAGFAHGFITLEDNSDLMYQITPAHRPGQGVTLRWDDPDLAIAWPLRPVILSESDKHAPSFSQYIEQASQS
jgi:dTDP-4-dehydrorhamnose 3,5-epimerase